jgi:hypothetical protein
MEIMTMRDARKNPVRRIAILGAIVWIGSTLPATASEMREGFWTQEQAQTILNKALRVHLAPSLDALSPGERIAVDNLLEVGAIMQRLYEDSRHPEALVAHEELLRLHNAGENHGRTQVLSDLYRLSKGPIATTLDNKRLPFLPVADETPGKNVYPAGITKEEIEGLLAEQPEVRRQLLDLRAVVRRAERAKLDADLATLAKHPALAVLHPGLTERLIALQNNLSTAKLYAVPYSVAYADDLLRAHELLNLAATAIEEEDAAFARYLRNRSRDFLSDDYESGDASWITGRFQNLNVQVGSYETYDDQLYGVKSFFGLSLLIRDHERSAELAAAIDGLQAIENSLPYESNRKIRSDIPVGVYNVIADFGQTRGANTATILPNESYLARQYGRTILLRGNILTHPNIFDISKASFEAAVHPAHHADLTPEARLYRTLWHEIGHYLGVDRTADGQDLSVALQDTADLLEEMKSDLVSLFSVQQLTEAGYYTGQEAQAVYAGGILRVLQKTQPRRSQPYQTMQLMQWNWFLEHEVLRFDESSGTLRIDYGRYHNAVALLLAEVLSVQSAGDRERAEDFVQKYTSWDDALHGVVAGNMRAREVYRYSLVTYDAIGDSRPTDTAH